jgi:hypothetical protein
LPVSVYPMLFGETPFDAAGHRRAGSSRSMTGPVIRLPLSIGRFLDRGATVHPDRLAVIDDPAMPLPATTYGTPAARVAELAAYLDKLGMAPGPFNASWPPVQRSTRARSPRQRCLQSSET